MVKKKDDELLYNITPEGKRAIELTADMIPGILKLQVDNNLKENMVITNEPGIYLPGKFGVRIEDTVLIGKEASENLTKSSKDYIIVDKQ